MAGLFTKSITSYCVETSREVLGPLLTRLAGRPSSSSELVKSTTSSGRFKGDFEPSVTLMRGVADVGREASGIFGSVREPSGVVAPVREPNGVIAPVREPSGVVGPVRAGCRKRLLTLMVETSGTRAGLLSMILSVLPGISPLAAPST